MRTLALLAIAAACGNDSTPTAASTAPATPVTAVATAPSAVWSLSETVGPATATTIRVAAPVGYRVTFNGESQLIPTTIRPPADAQSVLLAITAPSGATWHHPVAVADGHETLATIRHEEAPAPRPDPAAPTLRGTVANASGHCPPPTGSFDMYVEIRRDDERAEIVTAENVAVGRDRALALPAGDYLVRTFRQAADESVLVATDHFAIRDTGWFFTWSCSP